MCYWYFRCKPVVADYRIRYIYISNGVFLNYIFTIKKIYRITKKTWLYNVFIGIDTVLILVSVQYIKMSISLSKLFRFWISFKWRRKKKVKKWRDSKLLKMQMAQINMPHLSGHWLYHKNHQTHSNGCDCENKLSHFCYKYSKIPFEVFVILNNLKMCSVSWILGEYLCQKKKKSINCRVCCWRMHSKQNGNLHI